MRLAIAHPCMASGATVFKMSRSRVPWTRSLGFPIPRLSTLCSVDRQGIEITFRVSGVFTLSPNEWNQAEGRAATILGIACQFATEHLLLVEQAQHRSEEHTSELQSPM